MTKKITPAIFGLAAATVFGALALPASAQTQPAAPAAEAPKHHAHHDAATPANPEEAVEKHIADQKTALKITDAQASQWDAFAATIRDNAKAAEARHQAQEAAAAGNQTALDDLKAYADATVAHADGVKKLAAAFETLYNAMTPEQKKNADDYFAHRAQQREQHEHHHAQAK